MPAPKARSASAKTKVVNGRTVSAKSRTGSAACSQAMSDWVRTRKAGTTPASVYAQLGKCRSMARAGKQATQHRAAGNEAKAQRYEALAAGKKGPISAKDRLARAKELRAELNAKRTTAPVAAKAFERDPKVAWRRDERRNTRVHGTMAENVANAKATRDRRRESRVQEKRYNAVTAHRETQGKPTGFGARLDRAKELRAELNAKRAGAGAAPVAAKAPLRKPRDPEIVAARKKVADDIRSQYRTGEQNVLSNPDYYRQSPALSGGLKDIRKSTYRQDVKAGVEKAKSRLPLRTTAEERRLDDKTQIAIRTDAAGSAGYRRGLRSVFAAPSFPSPKAPGRGTPERLAEAAKLRKMKSRAEPGERLVRTESGSLAYRRKAMFAAGVKPYDGSNFASQTPAPVASRPLGAFGQTLNPLARGKAKAALDATVSHNGNVMTRKAMIDAAIKNGATVQQAQGGRRLTSSSGAFLDEKATTKTGMNYADSAASRLAQARKLKAERAAKRAPSPAAAPAVPRPSLKDQAAAHRAAKYAASTAKRGHINAPVDPADRALDLAIRAKDVSKKARTASLRAKKAGKDDVFAKKDAAYRVNFARDEKLAVRSGIKQWRAPAQSKVIDAKFEVVSSAPVASRPSLRQQADAARAARKPETIALERIGANGPRGGASAYVAAIKGPDSKYGAKREFMAGKRDYSNANSVGSRGVTETYTLPRGGVYEINEPRSWKNVDRYHVVARAKGLKKVSKERAIEIGARLEKFKARQAAKSAAPASSSAPALSPSRPSLRQQADAARAAKGTTAERAKKLHSKMNRKYAKQQAAYEDFGKTSNHRASTLARLKDEIKYNAKQMSAAEKSSAKSMIEQLAQEGPARYSASTKMLDAIKRLESRGRKVGGIYRSAVKSARA